MPDLTELKCYMQSLLFRDFSELFAHFLKERTFLQCLNWFRRIREGIHNIHVALSESVCCVNTKTLVSNTDFVWTYTLRTFVLRLTLLDSIPV